MKKAILFLLILSSILFLPACENNNVNISVDDTQKVSTSSAQNLFLAEENAGYDYTSDSPQADTTAKAQTQTKTQTQAVSKTSATGSPAVTETDADPQSKIVYITDTGKKYHRDGCQYLRESRHAISLEDAQNEGYSPCKKCFRT